MNIYLYTYLSTQSFFSRMASEFSSSRVVDLTHVINDKMPTWIENQGFNQKQIFFVEKDGYAIHTLTFQKAGIGTHFDSAAHFFNEKRTVRILCMQIEYVSCVLFSRYMNILLMS